MKSGQFNSDQAGKVVGAILFGLFLDSDRQPIRLSKRALEEARRYVQENDWPAMTFDEESSDYVISYKL